MYIKYPNINGFYLHYKGGKYQVLFLATHSETGEPMVVYKSISFGSTYVRPLSIWNEEVLDPNSKKAIKRFEFFGYNPNF